MLQVWPPTGLKKFETLSYLPPLSDEALLKEISYLLRSGWIPCLEFELEVISLSLSLSLLLYTIILTEPYLCALGEKLHMS